jgi:hypothetical protein
LEEVLSLLLFVAILTQKDDLAKFYNGAAATRNSPWSLFAKEHGLYFWGVVDPVRRSVHTTPVSFRSTPFRTCKRFGSVETESQ